MRRAAENGVGKLTVEAARYYARIYAVARAECLSVLRRDGCRGEEAEDIFAATFERIMGRFDPVELDFLPAKMVAMLKKACRQKLIDERRHQGVIRMTPLGDLRPQRDEDTRSPAELAEEHEATAIAQEAISSLCERDRLIFLQRHQLGLSPEEILHRNPGLSLRSYRKILQRANARALSAFEEIEDGARCDQMRSDRLRRYVGEEFTGTELAAVEAHLRHCRGCRLATAQMRDRLHTLAGGLGVLLTAADGHGGFLAGYWARLLEAIGQGEEALSGLIGALRERLRDAMLRADAALPGAGAQSAGQLVGASGVKALSVCAAGTIAATCLAAGVVPGVGELAVLGHQGHRHSSERTRVADPAASRDPARAVRVSSPSSMTPTRTPSPPPRRAASQIKREVRERAIPTRSSPEAPEHSARPTFSSQQTGAEFGTEAEGTATPLPSGSSGGGAVSSEGRVDRSRSTGESAGAPKAAAEFGF